MKPPEDLPSNGIYGYWYYGKTGCGKSYAARHDFPSPYLKTANNKWWDGYDSKVHEYALLDDLDKKHDYMGYHLKIWADRYAFQVEIKGGAKMIRPKAIIVTSNYHPRDIWDDESTLHPILRRFKVVRFCTLQERVFGDEEEEQRLAYVRPPPGVPEPITRPEPVQTPIIDLSFAEITPDLIFNSSF
jgi:hypothetical protein